jgi:hypothetical protein
MTRSFSHLLAMFFLSSFASAGIAQTLVDRAADVADQARLLERTARDQAANQADRDDIERELAKLEGLVTALRADFGGSSGSSGSSDISDCVRYLGMNGGLGFDAASAAQYCLAARPHQGGLGSCVQALIYMQVPTWPYFHPISRDTAAQACNTARAKMGEVPGCVKGLIEQRYSSEDAVKFCTASR